MRASQESNDRACEVVTDQGQFFQVKHEQNWLLFYLLTELSTMTLKKTFFHLRQFRFLFSVLRSIH